MRPLYGRSRARDARRSTELLRHRLGRQDDEMVAGPRATDVQVSGQVLWGLVVQLGQDHHGAFEPLEPMDARDQYGSRLRLVGQPEPVDGSSVAEPALLLARRREYNDVPEGHLFFPHQVTEHQREEVRQVVVVTITQDLRWPSGGAVGRRLALAPVEDRHELVDRLGVPEVGREGRHAKLWTEGQGLAIEILVVVGKQVEHPSFWIPVQGEECRPPPLPEVLRFVDNDGVVPRAEGAGGAFQQFRELALEEIRARFHRAFGDRESGLLCHPDTDIVEMAHVEAFDSLGGCPQVLAETPVEAREQGPKTLCRKALRELDG